MDKKSTNSQENTNSTLLIASVSKSFYCFEKDDNSRKCKNQCDICRDSKLKPN